MKIIDIHNHPNWHGHTIDDLVRNMDEIGIEKTWLLSWEISQREYEYESGYYMVMDPRGVGASLSMVIEGLQKYPDRFIGGWAPDPRDKNVRAKLKAAVDIYGIKVYGELKCRTRYDNPDAIITFRYCGELGLPVLFHLQMFPTVFEQADKSPLDWPTWYGGDMTVVDNMCRLCPKTKFIGHGPGFWWEISGDADTITEGYPKGKIKPGGRLIKLLDEYDNLYCDLSAGSGANALERDLEHAREFVIKYQDRVMFGRDYFDRRQLDVLEKLDLPTDVMEKILYKNAEKILQTS